MKNIPQETKDLIIRNYNNYKTAEYTLNMAYVTIADYYKVINEAREKGLITIPKHSPKPKPPKPIKQKKHPLNVEKITEPPIYRAIIDYYNQGYTYADIAVKVGVPRNRVRYYLTVAFHKEDCDPKYRKCPRTKIVFSQVEVDNIKQMFYNGENMRRIANALGVAPQTVERVIKENGWKRDDPQEIINQRILYLYRCGLTYGEIAKKINRSKGYVSQHLAPDEKDRWQPVPRNTINDILNLYKEGLTMAQISRATEVKYMTVRQILQKYEYIR